jgi:hypothetical protein
LYKKTEACPQKGELSPCYFRSLFVKHIAFVNVFNNNYLWKISDDIPNGKDYIVRISVGKRFLPCVLPQNTESRNACLREKLAVPSGSRPEIWPPVSRVYWDESDGNFTITGNITPSPIPDLTGVIKSLEKLSSDLERTAKELVNIIAILKGMLK